MPRDAESRLNRLIKSDRPSKDVARILGVSQRTVQRYRAAGQINPKTGRPKEARKPSQATRARIPVKLPPRQKPRRGKHKATKADRRYKRNTASRVKGGRTLASKVKDRKRVRVQMRATYDYTDSPGKDVRHRTVIFPLTSFESAELARIMESEGFDETFTSESAQVIGDFLIKTRAANYMRDGKVYNIEDISIL